MKKASGTPLLPRCAVDEWGFVSETHDKNAERIRTVQEEALKRFDRWRKTFREFTFSIGLVNDKIVEATALYCAEFNGYVASEADDKLVHLLFVNLGFAWNELQMVQSEFRHLFGHLYDEHSLRELEFHETSNIRHAWSVTFALRHERQRHLTDSRQMVEALAASHRSRFLKALAAEAQKAIGPAGTVTVRPSPWLIDGTAHLCIVCDYNTLDTIETGTPEVVQAAWRAARSVNWRHLEWKPLEIEWPKIALVNLVHGRALAPACAKFSIVALFGSSDTFEVKPHHHIALPIPVGDFLRGGFKLWESPLLRSMRTLYAQCFAFALTYVRFYRLAALVFEQHLTQAHTDRILDEFSNELRIVLTVAQRSYHQAADILQTVQHEETSAWVAELHRICSILLLTVSEDAAITIDLNSFTEWVEQFNATRPEFEKLSREIIIFAVEAERTL